MLYIGKSVDMRARVKQYFTASEARRRMAEMVAIAEEVVPLPCATLLEAEVRELRMIAEYKPPYNRRSRFPEKVSLPQAHGRVVSAALDRARGQATTTPPTSARSVPSGRPKLPRRRCTRHSPLRQCTSTLALRTGDGSACMLAEIHRCGAPCEGRQSPDEYAAHRGGCRPRDDRRCPPDRDARPPERMAPLASQSGSRTRCPTATGYEHLLAALPAPSACGPWAAAPSSSPPDRLPSTAGRSRSSATGGWQRAGVAPPGVAPKPFVESLRRRGRARAPAPGRLPRGGRRRDRVPAALARLGEASGSSHLDGTLGQSPVTALAG